MIAEVFRATLDLLDQPLLIVSGETPATSRVLYSNPALHRVSGFQADSLLGLPISATLADPLWLTGPFDAARQSPPAEATMPMKKADGTVQLARWRIDRHPGENQLYVVLVAPFANRAGDDDTSFPRLLSEIRHELGNPINSIKAALTLIRRGFGPSSGQDVYSLPAEKMAFYLDAVFSELERVERVLESLRRLGEKSLGFSSWPTHE